MGLPWRISKGTGKETSAPSPAGLLGAGFSATWASARPATVATAGPRYFGSVTGGALPAALAANWLAGAWDQNCVTRVSSPMAAAMEDRVIDWLLDIFGLAPDGGGALVTGATMANFSGLAAAPPVTILAGVEESARINQNVEMLADVASEHDAIGVKVIGEGRSHAEKLGVGDTPQTHVETPGGDDLPHAGARDLTHSQSVEE